MMRVVIGDGLGVEVDEDEEDEDEDGRGVVSRVSIAVGLSSLHV